MGFSFDTIVSDTAGLDRCWCNALFSRRQNLAQFLATISGAKVEFSWLYAQKPLARHHSALTLKKDESVNDWKGYSTSLRPALWAAAIRGFMRRVSVSSRFELQKLEETCSW